MTLPYNKSNSWYSYIINGLAMNPIRGGRPPINNRSCNITVDTSVQVVGYRIRQLPREFQFDSGVSGSGSPARPKLVLLSRLHLDSGPYTLIMTAHDGGEPAALTGSTTVVVSVEDSNDHQPTFEKELVTVKVSQRDILCGFSHDQRSYSTPGPVSTWMGDRLRAGKSSQYVNTPFIWEPDTLATSIVLINVRKKIKNVKKRVFYHKNKKRL